jgi:hypothetical protein
MKMHGNGYRVTGFAIFNKKEKAGLFLIVANKRKTLLLIKTITI